MARNLDEPGANFDQLLELALNLKNARAFAGKNGDYDWKEGDWTDPEDVDLYDWEPKPVIQEPRTTAQGTYGKFAQQIANGGRVGFENGGGVTSQLMSWLLSPKNLERLRNNKDLVRKLTKNKMLPSSVRLYLRNLAGVTDKITEDFFSKSELKEIKKRVAEAKAMGSMGYATQSGLTGTMKDNTIGYSHEGFMDQLSLKGAFTNPSTNIDMTLGQASFSTDKNGNVTVKDTHNFAGVEGSGYKGKSLRKHTFEQAVPHPYEEGSMMDTLLKGTDVGRSFKVEESDKQFLARAKRELEAGNIDPSKYARIVGGMEQGEGIPIEMDIGKITHEDKLKADPFFADYIAQDTKSGYGVEYEDVGIPSKIRKHAKKYGS